MSLDEDAPVQAEVLRAIAELAAFRGDDPCVGHVLDRLGWATSSRRRELSRLVERLRARGALYPQSKDRRDLRLTVRGRLLLELPIVVYLAWAVPTERSARELWEMCMLAGIEYANELVVAVPGIVPVSPYFTAARGQYAAGPVLAVRCDGVIVMRDPLLIGRPDVRAAQRLGIPIALLPDVASCGSDPWVEPFLLTGDPQKNSPR